MADAFQREGGQFRVARVRPVTGRFDGLRLMDGETLTAQHYVFGDTVDAEYDATFRLKSDEPF